MVSLKLWTKIKTSGYNPAFFMTYIFRQKGRWVYLSFFHTPSKPIEPFVFNLLNTELSYKRNGYFPNPLWAIVKLYQPKRQRFGIGLLNRVLKLFDANSIEYVLDLDTSPITQDLQIKDKGLRDYQLNAIKALNSNRGGILSLPTGAGKTRTALALIEAVELPTLVVVPTLDLKLQWEERITTKNVIVSTFQSLKSKPFIQQFKLVVFDECHIVAAKTLQLIGLNLSENAITIGLSATPMMRDNDNMKVEAVLGEIVYSVTLRDLISRGFLVDATVYYHKIKSDSSPFMDYPEAYEENIVNNYERNKKIADLAKQSSGHVLILVDRIEHGELLLELLLNEDCVFLHGKSKDRTDTDHRIIIATSIFDQGVDIPHLQTLILGGSGKSFIKVVQRIGRVLRTHDNKEKAIVHDFLDDTKWFKKHSMERKAIFTQDFEVIELDE